MVFHYPINIVECKFVWPILVTVLLGHLSVPGVCGEASVVLPPTATADEILEGFIGKPTGSTRAMGSGLCPSGKVVAINIPFDYDSAALTSQAKATLAAVAQAMGNTALSKCGFYVEGHTDAKGSFKYNMTLSEKRASSVEKYLSNIGVQRGRLVSVGMGPKQPINAADPLADENRRVEFRTR